MGIQCSQHCSCRFGVPLGNQENVPTIDLQQLERLVGDPPLGGSQDDAQRNMRPRTTFKKSVESPMDGPGSGGPTHEVHFGGSAQNDSTGSGLHAHPRGGGAQSAANIVPSWAGNALDLEGVWQPDGRQ